MEARWLGQSRPRIDSSNPSVAWPAGVVRRIRCTGRAADTRCSAQNTTRRPSAQPSCSRQNNAGDRVSPATTIGACRQAGPIDSRQSVVTSPLGTECTGAPRAARAAPKARASACRSSISTIGKAGRAAASAPVGRGAPITPGSAAQTVPCRNSRRLVRRSPSRAYLPVPIRPSSDSARPLLLGAWSPGIQRRVNIGADAIFDQLESQRFNAKASRFIVVANHQGDAICHL